MVSQKTKYGEPKGGSGRHFPFFNFEYFKNYANNEKSKKHQKFLFYFIFLIFHEKIWKNFDLKKKSTFYAILSKKKN